MTLILSTILSINITFVQSFKLFNAEYTVQPLLSTVHIKNRFSLVNITLLGRRKSETRMAASILKQDSHIKGFKKIN